jgi:hypothetical protein
MGSSKTKHSIRRILTDGKKCFPLMKLFLIESTLSSELNHWKYSYSAFRKMKLQELLKVMALKIVIGISNLFCRINAPLFHHINRNKRYKVLKK